MSATRNAINVRDLLLEYLRLDRLRDDALCGEGVRDPRANSRVVHLRQVQQQHAALDTAPASCVNWLREDQQG